MKYKLKQDCIEAFQYSGKIVDDNGTFCIPDWLVSEYKSGKIYLENVTDNKGDWMYYDDGIRTWVIEKGGYIIKTDSGMVCACNKKMFENVFTEVKQ